MEQEPLLSQEITADEVGRKEDMRWTTSKKGWNLYWAKKFTDQSEAFPENIISTADKILKKEKSDPEALLEFQRLVNKKIHDLYKAFPEEAIEIKEEEKILKDESANFDSFLETIEKTQFQILDHKLLPAISSSEKQELETDSDKKGARKWWLNHLLPETDIVREDVKNVLENFLKTKKMPNGAGQSVFDKYINQRREVLKFKIAKRLEMAQLKNNLKRIDTSEDMGEKEKKFRRTVFSEGENLFIKKGGETQKITLGDIMADYNWGVKYVPDISMPHKLWRKISKMIALKEARSRVEYVFNRELNDLESVGLPTSSYSVGFLERHSQAGAIAEKMAQTILSRIQYNSPESGIKVESSNALEDIELKYDFKIVLPEKKRGVAVEGDEMPREEYVKEKRKLGIQFTIASKENLLEHKKHQIEEARSKIGLEKYRSLVKKPVDDIVLVSVPLKTYGECFKKWLEAGKPSGGPEQFLTEEERERLITAITSGPAVES